MAKYNVKTKKVALDEAVLDRNAIYAEDKLKRLFDNSGYSIKKRVMEALTEIEKTLYRSVIDESDIEAYNNGEEVEITKELHPNITTKCTNKEIKFIEDSIEKIKDFDEFLEELQQADIFNITSRI